MNSKKIRVIIPLAIIAIAGIGYAIHLGTGTLSAFGWQDISLLCPLGALGTMIASKTFVPHALVSLAIAVVAILVLGRAFCGWICPVPLIARLRTILKRQPQESKNNTTISHAPRKECDSSNINQDEDIPSNSTQGDFIKKQAPLTKNERSLLKHSCHSCSKTVPEKSRHIVLGGALLSAAIFGFPVFCLICPIGLTFAFIFTLMLLFGNGDVTWGVIVIPMVILIEVVFFRKWCSHLCPLSAFMSIIGKANKTFLPVIDTAKCLESPEVSCGRCGQICEAAINPRHPEQGASWSECTKCRACIDACPAHAISLPLIAKHTTSKERKHTLP